MTLENHDAADVIARLRAEIDRLEDVESECHMWRRRARDAIASVRPHINGPFFKEAYDNIVKSGGDGALRTEWLRVFSETVAELKAAQDAVTTLKWQQHAHSEDGETPGTETPCNWERETRAVLVRALHADPDDDRSNVELAAELAAKYQEASEALRREKARDFERRWQQYANSEDS